MQHKIDSRWYVITLFVFRQNCRRIHQKSLISILVDLLGLLNWSSHKETLEASLNALLDVSPEEVVKFLQDILDALFNILVQNEDPARFDNLVFKCLLRLIEIVSDLKYQHFQSVLDLYINESFSATLAYE